MKVQIPIEPIIDSDVGYHIRELLEQLGRTMVDELAAVVEPYDWAQFIEFAELHLAKSR